MNLSPAKLNLLVDDEKIMTSSSIGDVSVPWAAVKELWKFPDFWLLFFSKSQFITLPLNSVSVPMRQFIAERVELIGGRVAGEPQRDLYGARRLSVISRHAASRFFLIALLASLPLALFLTSTGRDPFLIGVLFLAPVLIAAVALEACISWFACLSNYGGGRPRYQALLSASLLLYCIR